MRFAVRSASLLALFCACGPTGAEQDQATAGQDQTTEDLIALALTAAPPEIAVHATVMDFGGTVLRQGSNGWTCIPVPDAPLCLDGVWMAWLDARANRETPVIESLGISYMLAGDAGASNTDPFATGPTADNEWVRSGPHLMLLVPDARALEAIPTDPRHGGPFVMWKGTPYAHVMVPVSPPGAVSTRDTAASPPPGR